MTRLLLNFILMEKIPEGEKSSAVALDLKK